MRLLITVAVCAVMMSVNVRAKDAYKIPGSAFRVAELEKAQEKAAKSKKPLCFIKSQQKTTCPLCVTATTEAFKKFKSKTVLVYVESADWAKLPKEVQKAFVDPKMGRYIPKTVILTPDYSEVVSLVPYATGKQRKEYFKAAVKNIREAVKKLKTPPAE